MTNDPQISGDPLPQRAERLNPHGSVFWAKPPTEAPRPQLEAVLVDDTPVVPVTEPVVADAVTTVPVDGPVIDLTVVEEPLHDLGVPAVELTDVRPANRVTTADLGDRFGPTATSVVGPVIEEDGVAVGLDDGPEPEIDLTVVDCATPIGPTVPVAEIEADVVPVLSVLDVSLAPYVRERSLEAVVRAEGAYKGDGQRRAGTYPGR